MQWETIHSQLKIAIEQYQPEQRSKFGISRKEYLTEQLNELKNIKQGTDERRKLALLITAIEELLDSTTLKKLIVGVVAPPDGNQWKTIVDTLRDEFLILDSEREGIKNALNGAVMTIPRTTTACFFSPNGEARAAALRNSAAPPASSSAPSIVCPNDKGWEKLKSYLTEVANSVLADVAKNDLQKTVAGNLIVELRKARDVSAPKIQRFLLNLAGAVFLDNDLVLKNLWQYSTEELLRQAIKSAGINADDLSAMLKKLKKPAPAPQLARSAIGDGNGAIEMSGDLPALNHL